MSIKLVVYFCSIIRPSLHRLALTLRSSNKIYHLEGYSEIKLTESIHLLLHARKSRVAVS
jgi:hypothetical protein